MLFQLGNFNSSSGLTLDYKIECDALDNIDLECLSYIISKKIKFSSVEGVPTGGLRIENYLIKFIDSRSNTLLIVDDVLTTGASMEKQRGNRNAIGVVLFARGKCPNWIIPMFSIPKGWS